MFEQVIESVGKATESTLQMQQELFKKWTALWPGMSAAPPAWGDQPQKFQKKWAETVAELVKKQRDFVEAQFKVGMENLDTTFKLGEAKSVEELRAQTLDLYKKCFESLRTAYETQVRDFQAAMNKWTEFVTTAAS